MHIFLFFVFLSFWAIWSFGIHSSPLLKNHKQQTKKSPAPKQEEVLNQIASSTVSAEQAKFAPQILHKKDVKHEFLNKISIYLSPKQVAQKVLNHSLRYQKVQAEEQASPKQQVEVMAFLDWQFFAQTHFNSQTQTPLQFFETSLEDKNQTITGIEKQFLTGTRFKGQYFFTHLEKDFTPEFKKISSAPSSTFKQGIKLEIEQDLWRNIFGYEDKIKIQIATAKTKALKIKLLEAKEDLILQALNQFWIAYISQVDLKLTKTKAQDYKTLFYLTKKKQALGYIKPGELTQIQAEWERAKQQMRWQKTDYENKTAKLLELINHQGLVKLTPPIEIPPPSTHKTPWPQNPRAVMLRQQQLFIQEQELARQKSTTWPSLKLFGSYSISGYDTDLSSSFEGLKERRNQNHSVGVKFLYPFSSSSVRKKRIHFHEQALEASRHSLAISQKEFMLLQEQSQKNIITLYQNFKSTKKILKLRTQSYKAIRKAFLQGRLSVFDLIKARELSLLAEQEKNITKAKYYQALDYKKAEQDQLIPFYQRVAKDKG